MPVNKPASNTTRHVLHIQKAARGLFAADGVIEDALDAVICAAVKEFDCRVVFTAPARLIVDGAKYEWPAIDDGESKER
jgi:hypothetical protein